MQRFKRQVSYLFLPLSFSSLDCLDTRPANVVLAVIEFLHDKDAIKAILSASGALSAPRGSMKNPYDVLHIKEQRVYQLRRETEVLRFVLGLLLDEEGGSDTSVPNTTPGGRPAAHLLTNSKRLEVVVGGASRLRFAGRMRIAMEVMRIGKEFHIFLPTQQPMSVSYPGQLEERAHDSSSGSSGRKKPATKERSARSTLYAPEPQWEGA